MPDPLALALTPGVGPKRLAQALQTDLSPEAIARTLGSEVGRAYRQTLREGRAERERERAQRMGLRLIGLWEEAYPERLRHLDNPPTVLYLRGRLPGNPKNIGIVGTRKASPWAVAWTQRVARELAKAGVGVISGLALGVDAAAHRGALEGGGYTLGVLGSGMDRLYPPQNRALAEQMHLLSEFPLGTPPQAGLFPGATASWPRWPMRSWWWRPGRKAAASSPPGLPWSSAGMCWRCQAAPATPPRWAATD